MRQKTGGEQQTELLQQQEAPGPPELTVLAAVQTVQLLRQYGPEPNLPLLTTAEGQAIRLQAVMQADVEIVNNHSVPVEIKVSIIIHKPAHQ